jgi:hypothetical protein
MAATMGQVIDMVTFWIRRASQITSAPDALLSPFAIEVSDRDMEK